MAFQVRRTKSGSTNIGVESWNDDMPTCHKPHWVEETHLRYSEKELCPRSEVRWLNQSDGAREDQHTLVSLAVIQRKSIAWWWRGDKGTSVLLTIATPKKVEKVQTPMNLYWWLEAFCIFGVQDSLVNCFRQCCINSPMVQPPYSPSIAGSDISHLPAPIDPVIPLRSRLLQIASGWGSHFLESMMLNLKWAFHHVF